MTLPCDIHIGDCLDVLPTLDESSVDAVVTDPPYGLNFMGKEWDRGVPGETYWRAVLRVLKPGGYALCFGGTRTYHRLACAVEDAGFEVRDCLMWLYGQGFPKGSGTNLKPAWEPILLYRKPGPKVLSLGVDTCRVPCDGGSPAAKRRETAHRTGNHPGQPGAKDGSKRVITNRVSYETYVTPHAGEAEGRYPANVIHDGSEEVMATFGDSGTAARFFYCAKAGKKERGAGNTHPTVKPLSLLEWLVKLVCPEGGTVLDPFMGSGTTGIACVQTGRGFIGIEIDEGYARIAAGRLEAA